MAMLGAGIGLNIAGTVLKGIQAEEDRDAMQKIANTPGVDIGAATGESLRNMETYLPPATALTGKLSKANQANLLAEEEAALPGAGAARLRSLNAINQLFSDDAEWLSGVQRRGAALGLGRGLFGSQAGQIGTLRLSDQEKMGRTQLGTGLLGSLLSGLRIANTPGVQAFLGPTASETVGIRSQERAQKMAYQAQKLGMPSMFSEFGNNLQSVGGMGFGAGMQSMIGNSGMGNNYQYMPMYQQQSRLTTPSFYNSGTMLLGTPSD